MNPIPTKLKKELEQDPYYKKCCLTGITNGKIDWHHVWKYSGRQINERWAIMPILERKHSPMGDPDSVHRCQITKEKVELLSLQRATIDDFRKYPRNNWKQIKEYLTNKFKK